MGNLLFEESPLVLSPTIAKIVGVDRAIVLQQIHYWVEKNKVYNKNFREGFYWTYNTYEDWQKSCFGFWSVRTVRRLFSSLVKNKLLITGNYNKLKIDRTIWYRINHTQIKNLITEHNLSYPCAEIGHKDVMFLDTPLPENKTDIKNNTSKKFFDDDSEEMIIVKFFISKILELDKDIRVPNSDQGLQSWCKSINYILRIDKREKEEICSVISFALSNNFWQKNILSPKNLRDKYDRLKLTMKYGNSRNTKSHNDNRNNKNNEQSDRDRNRENIRNETYLHLEKLKLEKIAADAYREELALEYPNNCL